MTVDRFYADRLVIESREGSFCTRGRLISAADAEQWKPLFDALLHCHNARRVRQSDGRFVLSGDPTEVALLQFANDHGLAHRPSFRRMGELAFDADRKRMSTLHWVEGRLTAFVKGAPEALLGLCSHILIHGQAEVMAADERLRILSQSRLFAEQAYRVLAVASRKVVHQPEHIEEETIETDLTFLGLIAMIDPRASRSTCCHRNLPQGRCPRGDDHRRPCAHRSGHCAENRPRV